MSHHSDDLLVKRFEERGKDVLGKTGRFPHGKIQESDEGEIRFQVGRQGNKVLLDFGKRPIAWIGMTGDQAIELGNSLRKHGIKLNKKPL